MYSVSAQHHSAMSITVDPESKMLKIQQEITYYNNTKDTLKDYILNDWNNAYSDRSTPLAKRFSDEFTRIFHLAGESDRGHTNIVSVIDQNQRRLEWSRLPNQPEVAVRDLGTRDLHDVPPAEVAELMANLDMADNTDELFRAVLQWYGLTRLTQQTEARLQQIFDRLVQPPG